MKHYDSLIVLAIIVLVVMQPTILVQLNSTMLGKIVLLGSLIAITLYKPYIGLLVLLLIVCLTMYREGFDNDMKEEEDENIYDLSVENEEKLQP